MPVTLEQAKQNAQAAYTPFVIDEFVKSAPLLGALTFDDAVSPTGGSTLVYGYRRLVSRPVRRSAPSTPSTCPRRSPPSRSSPN